MSDRAWLQAILDASLDAIVGYDADGVIRTFNGAAVRLYGHCRDEAVGQPVSILGSGAEHVRKDGAALDVESKAATVEGDDGAPLGTIMVMRERSTRGANHDLNNLLGIIVSFAVFVEEELVPGSQAAEDIQEVLRAAKRAGELARGRAKP